MPGGRTLDGREARRTVEAALAGSPVQCVGLEVERLVRDPGRPTERPGPERLAGVLGGSPLPAGSAVTLEPGGQIEVSTVAADSVAGALDRLRRDETELAARLRALGLRADPAAVDTSRPPARVLGAPRYAAMERFLAADGEAGGWMMCNTASLQVNVSHAADRLDLRWRRAHALGPVLVAAFAASPGHDRSGRRWESLRQAIWWSMDPGRTRPPRPRGSLVSTWLGYALAADVMLVRSPDGTAVPMRPGVPFARWCHEGLDVGGARRFPDADDLRYHLTTLFPPVRPRGWLELRMLDALPPDLAEVATLVAVVALAADPDDDLVAALPDTGRLWRAAARHGLAHPVLAAAARHLFAGILDRWPAELGPERRDAVGDHLETHVARGLSPAQYVPDEAVADALRPCLGPVRPVAAGARTS